MTVKTTVFLSDISIHRNLCSKLQNGDTGDGTRNKVAKPQHFHVLNKNIFSELRFRAEKRVLFAKKGHIYSPSEFNKCKKVDFTFISSYYRKLVLYLSLKGLDEIEVCLQSIACVNDFCLVPR